MNESDETLYRRFLSERKEGDFRVLLERHRGSLILFLYGIVHNMEDAEELMMDAFAEAAAGAGFSGKSSFKTWLFSIGKKLAFMQMRRARPLTARQEAQPDEAALSPELGILRQERDRELWQAIQGLKDEYRQILILLYFERMTHEEAARVMGKNRKQVYNLAERSRRALKQELEGMGFDDARLG